MLQELSVFFTFLEQCCDADKYLRLGEICAETGHCYHQVRPMGAIYWFSIPFRLGLPPAAVLIAANILLAIVSVLLSVAALQNLLRLYLPLKQRLLSLVIIIVSVIIHAVFLYPLLRVSLSDAPASLLILISIWLLLLFSPRKAPDFISCALIGLCLGLGAWTRVFFIYPVLIVVLLGVFILWSKRKAAAMGLLLVLLPVAIQFFNTWKNTGAYSYLDPKSSKSMTTFHLNDRRSGYDTVLSADPRYYWYPSCKKYLGIMDALHAGDVRSLRCLTAGRLNFYLGSYALRTYSPSSLLPGEFRLWSPWILGVNVVACMCALFLFVALRKQLQPLQWLAPLLLSLSAGMALLIIPEQRFAIVPMISIWIFFLAWWLLFIMGKRNLKL